MKRVPPEELEFPEPPAATDPLTDAAAAVIQELANRWTAWRGEFGIEEEGRTP